MFAGFRREVQADRSTENAHLNLDIDPESVAQAFRQAPHSGQTWDFMELANMFGDCRVDNAQWERLMSLMWQACKDGSDGPAIQRLPVAYACLQRRGWDKAVLHLTCTHMPLEAEGTVCSHWVQEFNVSDLQTLPRVVLLERGQARLQNDSPDNQEGVIIAEDFGPGSEWGSTFATGCPQHLWRFNGSETAAAQFPDLTLLCWDYRERDNAYRMGVGRGPGYTLPEGLQPSRRNLSQVIVNSAQINASCNLSQPLTCTEGLEQIALQLGLPRPSTSNVRLGGCPMPKQLLCLSVMYHNLTPENLQRVGRIQHAQGNLRTLHISDKKPFITTLSDRLCHMTQLHHLGLHNMGHLMHLPEQLGMLHSLVHLMLIRCTRMRRLPESLSTLTNLTLLWVETSALQSLPDGIGCLQQLRTVHLRDCRQLAALPDSVARLSNLSMLLLGCDRAVTSVPSAVPSSLDSLANLTLYANVSFPDSTSHLDSLSRLALCNRTGMAALPDSLINLAALHTLVLLDCHELATLPASFGRLSSLHALTVEKCGALSSIPPSLGELQHLSRLALRHNQSCQTIPDSISQLVLLQELDLEGCRALAFLPPGITLLTNLKRLSLAACPALLHALGNTTLHDWLHHMAVVYSMSPNSHHSRWPLVVDLLREGKLWEAKHRMTQLYRVDNFEQVDLLQRPTLAALETLGQTGRQSFGDELYAETVIAFVEVLRLIPLAFVEIDQDFSRLGDLISSSREYLIAARTLVELDRIHQDRGRAAELALYATRARLRPDHNAELLISAAQFNQDVGNLKTCARLCVNLQLRFYGMCPSQGLGPNKELAQNWKPLEMSEEEYEEVFDRSEALLERCGTGAQEDSYALEYDADRWLGLCCLSFKPVYKPESQVALASTQQIVHYVQCPYTRALFRPECANMLSPLGGLAHLHPVQSIDLPSFMPM